MAALPFDALDAVRMQANRRVATAETGVHLRRRMGQSLDFREHRQFVPGDDIRHVDWRASARIGGPADLFVRQFDAEDRLEVVVALDFGPTMLCPANAPKAAFATLIARALLWCAERGRDQITLAILGPEATVQATFALKGQGVLVRGEDWLHDQLAGHMSGAPANETMDPDTPLPPGGVCFLLSDFFGADPNGTLDSWARRTQQRHGILSAIQIDSWAHEVAPIMDQNVKFGAIGSINRSDEVVEAEKSKLEAGKLAAEAHVSARLAALQFGGLSRFLWPLDDTAITAPDRWLADHFARDPDLANALAVRK